MKKPGILVGRGIRGFVSGMQKNCKVRMFSMQKISAAPPLLDIHPTAPVDCRTTLAAFFGRRSSIVRIMATFQAVEL
jgi:hypothetical protein